MDYLRLCLCVFAASCAAPSGTSLRLRVELEEAWSLTALSLRLVSATGDTQTNANEELADELLIPLSDGWAGSELSLQVTGLRDGEPWAMGTAALTPSLGEENAATVVLSRVPCGAWCEPGETQCEGDGVSICEEKEGCSVWSAPVACASEAPFCSLGACGVACVDECAAGEVRCAGPLAGQTCGDFDTDDCLDWGPALSCAGEQVCSAGRCAAECTSECEEGALACRDGGVTSCGDLNADGCMEWSPARPCAYGQSCEGGVCQNIDECTDECSAPSCDGVSFSACGQFDLDACLDRSPGTSCVPSDPCMEGICTPSGCESVPRVCDAPPAATCEGSELVRFSRSGTCQAARGCVYPETLSTCPNGCESGACRSPCDGAACTQSENACQANVGTCMGDGTCVYAPIRGACDDGDGCTQDDTCNGGVCIGTPIACETPPETTCVDASTLRSFEGGSCRSGACDYVPRDLTCDHGCEAGECLPNRCHGACVPQLLAGRQHTPYSIALDDTHVYWTNYDSGVLRSWHGGSFRESIAGGQHGASEVALDATHVYWTNTTGDQVMRALKDGTERQTVASEQDGASGIAVDDTHVYWTSAAADEVMSARKDGTFIRVLATGQDGARDIAVDRTHIYWTNPLSFQVMRARKNGSGLETLAIHQWGAYRITLDDTHVYWTNANGGQVMRALKDGTGLEALASGQDSPAGIVVDATHVYWTNTTGDQVMRALKDGTGRQTVASGQDGVRGLGLDTTYVYWANSGSDEVMRLPLCCIP